MALFRGALYTAGLGPEPFSWGGWVRSALGLRASFWGSSSLLAPNAHPIPGVPQGAPTLTSQMEAPLSSFQHPLPVREVHFVSATPGESEDAIPRPNGGSLDPGPTPTDSSGWGGRGAVPNTSPPRGLTPQAGLLPQSLPWPVAVRAAPPRLRPRGSVWVLLWPQPWPLRWLWQGRDSEAAQRPGPHSPPPCRESHRERWG